MRYFIGLLGLLCATTTMAQTSDSTDAIERRVAALEAAASRVRFSGTFYSAYGYKTTPTGKAAHASAFTLDRWFLTAQARLNEHISFTGTTDIRPALADAKHGHAVIVAYAYADWAVRPRLSLQAGMVHGGWVTQVSKLWGYRGIARVLADEEKMLSVAVVGASATYAFPGKRGVAGIVLHNGQTRRAESDVFKEASAYVFGRPMDGWPVVAGAQFSHSDAPGSAGLDRWGGLAGLQGTRGMLAFNYEAFRTAGTTTQGYGLLSRVVLGKIERLGTVSFVGLADVYDPDTDAADDERLRTVTGLALSFAPGFNVSLDYQRFHTPTDVFATYDGALTDTDATLFVHVFLNY